MAVRVARNVLLVSLCALAPEAAKHPTSHQRHRHHAGSATRHAIISAKRHHESLVTHFVVSHSSLSVNANTGSNTATILQEIRTMRAELATRKRSGGWDEEFEAMECQLEDLEKMLQALEEKEKAQHSTHLVRHDELQAEIDHLGSELRRLGIDHKAGADCDHDGSEGASEAHGGAGEEGDDAPHEASVRGGAHHRGEDEDTADEGHAAAAMHKEPAPPSGLLGDEGVWQPKEEAAPPCDPSLEPRHKHSEAPDVDMQMPYGDLEPFGREDTAQELTEDSIRQSDAMVDQLERSEVAEEKRAVFRALTRLRGAAITSYDGIARSQTGNIDDYARTKQWRMAHHVHHLASEEADVQKWAFPESAADF